MREKELRHSNARPRVNQPPDKILVVGRDPFSSDLLATALSQGLGCAALSTSRSSICKSVASCDARLAIISADLSSTPGEGYDLAASIAHSSPDTAIIMLLDQPTPDTIIRAFHSGAKGIFCQDEPMTELLRCIEQVTNGFIWAGRRISATLLEIFKGMPAPGLLAGSEVGQALTARELQVVQCAATGKTNKSIAAELNLSEHTVKNYLFRAFAKLGVSSRVELLFYLSLRGQLAGQSIHTVDTSAFEDLVGHDLDDSSNPSPAATPTARR